MLVLGPASEEASPHSDGLEALRELVDAGAKPPKAAAVVAEVHVSHVIVPPNGNSMCVCGSMQPGMTYLPLASITLSACTSSDWPMREIVSSSTKTSPT